MGEPKSDEWELVVVDGDGVEHPTCADCITNPVADPGHPGKMGTYCRACYDKLLDDFIELVRRA